MAMSKEFREEMQAKLRDIEKQKEYDEFMCQFDAYQCKGGNKEKIGVCEIPTREYLEESFAKLRGRYFPAYLAREVCRLNLNPYSCDFPKDYDGVVALVKEQRQKEEISGKKEEPALSATPEKGKGSVEEIANVTSVLNDDFEAVAIRNPSETFATRFPAIEDLPENSAFPYSEGNALSDDEQRYHAFMRGRNLDILTLEEKLKLTKDALTSVENPSFIQGYDFWQRSDNGNQCFPETVVRLWEDISRDFKDNYQKYRQSSLDKIETFFKIDEMLTKLEREKNCRRKYLADYDLNTPGKNLKAGVNDTYDIVNKYGTWGGVVEQGLNRLLSPELEVGGVNKTLSTIDTVSGVLSGKERPLEKAREVVKDDLIEYLIQKSSDVLGDGYNELFNRDALNTSQKISCDIDEVNHDMQCNFSDFQPKKPKMQPALFMIM